MARFDGSLGLTATCAMAPRPRRRGGAGRRRHDSPRKARRAAAPCALDNSRGEYCARL